MQIFTLFFCILSTFCAILPRWEKPKVAQVAQVALFSQSLYCHNINIYNIQYYYIIL